jgi:hypothetical protein
VNELNRLGAFARPMEFPFLGLQTSSHLIEYRAQKWPADRPPQQIPIQWTPCTYGGARPWLICLCGRRVGRLYHGLGFLGCRACCNAAYESQRKGLKGRCYLKATRIRTRLGDYGRPGRDAIAARPSGMQRRSYNNLRAKLAMIESKLTEGGIYRPRPHRKSRDYARRT